MYQPGPHEEEQEKRQEPLPAGIVADAQMMYRLHNHGVRSLTDAEVLGIVLKSPDAGKSSAEFAQEVMDRVDGTIHGLGRLTMEDLQGMKGYGLTRARWFEAAMELGRRRNTEPRRERPTLVSSAPIFELLKPRFLDLTHEEFWCVMLDRGNRLIKVEQVSSGGMHGTVADPKIIFNRALKLLASSIVLSHNHPSGQLRPSEEDIRLTKKLVEGGRLLDIIVHDHIIMTDAGYYSFADNGMLH